MTDAKPTETKQEAQHERAFELLLLGKTDAYIAKQVGVTRATVWKWRTEPEFAGRLREARRVAQETARDGVKDLVLVALDTLRAAMEDDSGKVRLDAALHVLDRVDPVGSATEQARELLQTYLMAIVAHLAGDTDAETFAKTRASLGRFVQEGGRAKSLPQGLVVRVEAIDMTKETV